ncbi:Netrin-G1 [Bagarius yarrelli]|uniref:Netrin-G1 n=1 Tax=Bagarius yarrelli TaxID=175774 RepID=A0A556V3I7_BAGYA|nr:Netrin-G1 [Bagarius yarrelli]
MACQPESTDMTKFARVNLEPENITCGEPPEIYCTLENPYMCNNECDAATEELAHPPELMFDTEGRNPTTFWQSSTWKEYPKPLEVNITLSWDKTIELTDDIIITFESGRPEQMVLEKSLDYGRTWQMYQFYATDCLDAFGMEPRSVREISQHTLLDFICTEDYSRGYVWKYDKTVRFEIKDRFALFAGPRLHNMASLYGQLDTSRTLRDFFTLTDLRLRLLRPATGATTVDENNLNRYFYAISDIKIQGRCKCNLHANLCVFEKGKLSSRVCDEVLLRCLNGGVCVQQQRCVCPPRFSGVLCETELCSGGQSCEELQSGSERLWLSFLLLLLFSSLALQLSSLTSV